MLTACGRLGFEDVAASIDAPVQTVALCDTHTVMSLSLTGEATRVRAMVADIGYVVAIGTNSSNVYVARVPSSLDTADVHLPLSGGYTLGGVAHVANTTFVNATNGGTSYLKRLDPSFDSYATIESADNVTFDPPLAPRANGRAWRVARFNGFLEVADMDEAGNKGGPVANYAPTGTTATIADNRVVYEIDGGCETFVVDDSAMIAKLHKRTPCTDPQVAVLSSGRAVMVYRTDPSRMKLYAIPDDETATGTSKDLGDVTNARIAPAGDTAWVMVQKSTGVLLGQFDVALAGQEAAVPDVTGPFDITRSAAFWVEGAALRVGTPCLR